MSKKSSSVGFKKLKQIFKHIPNRELDALGYSEERLIAFLKINMLCCFTDIGPLLSLKKEQVKHRLIYLEQLNLKDLTANTMISMPLTPYLMMLIKKFAHDADSEYVFPYLKLTDKERTSLQQARAQGEMEYALLLRKIEVPKMQRFYVQMAKYLNRLAARLSPNKGITLYGIRKGMIRHYSKLILHMPTSQEEVMDSIAMASILLSTRNPGPGIFLPATLEAHSS